MKTGIDFHTDSPTFTHIAANLIGIFLMCQAINVMTMTFYLRRHHNEEKSIPGYCISIPLLIAGIMLFLSSFIHFTH